MKNLSSREKFLLKLLAALLFISGFFLFIFKPQMEELEANKIELEESQMKVQEMDMVLARFGKQDKVIKEKSAELDDKDDYLIAKSDNEELEKLIMNIAVNGSGIDITSIEISDATISYFDNYIGESETVETQDYNLKEYYFYVNDLENESVKVLSSEEVVLVKNRVYLHFTGSLDAYKTFINNIYNSDLSIYIANSEVVDGRDNLFKVCLDVYSVEGKN